MEKIEFKNYEDSPTTPINAQALNAIQDNVEQAIADVEVDVDFTELENAIDKKADKKDYIQTDDEYGSVGVGDIPKQEDNSLTVKGNIYAKNLEWTKITTALSQSTGTITLTDDITKYSEMLIQTGFTSTNTLWADTLYEWNNGNFVVGRTVNCNTYGGIFSATITNATTLTITKASNSVRFIWAR